MKEVGCGKPSFLVNGGFFCVLKHSLLSCSGYENSHLRLSQVVVFLSELNFSESLAGGSFFWLSHDKETCPEEGVGGITLLPSLQNEFLLGRLHGFDLIA